MIDSGLPNRHAVWGIAVVLSLDDRGNVRSLNQIFALHAYTGNYGLQVLKHKVQELAPSIGIAKSSSQCSTERLPLDVRVHYLLVWWIFFAGTRTVFLFQIASEAWLPTR